MNNMKEGTRESEGQIESQEELSPEILEIENLDRENSFVVTNERNENGDPVENVAWLRLDNGKSSVEGKFYVGQPEKSEKRKLVIFEPGLPGDGVIMMDSRHAPALAEMGYDVINLRHNGTVTQGEKAHRYVHCPEKEQRAAAQEQESMGKPFSYDEWRNEVLLATRSMADGYDEVHFIGHSMGAANIANALAAIERENPELLDRIKSFISLSGGMGKPKPEREGALDELKELLETWHQVGDDKKADLTKEIEPLLTKVTTNPDLGRKLRDLTSALRKVRDDGILVSEEPYENIRQYLQAIDRIYNTDYSGFSEMRFMGVSPTTRPKVFANRSEDEYCSILAQRCFQDHLAPGLKEKSRVVAYGGRAEPDRGKEVHDYAHLPTSFLVRWLNAESAEKTMSKR